MIMYFRKALFQDIVLDGGALSMSADITYNIPVLCVATYKIVSQCSDSPEEGMRRTRLS